MLCSMLASFVSIFLDWVGDSNFLPSNFSVSGHTFGSYKLRIISTWNVKNPLRACLKSPCTYFSVLGGKLFERNILIFNVLCDLLNPLSLSENSKNERPLKIQIFNGFIKFRTRKIYRSKLTRPHLVSLLHIPKFIWAKCCILTKFAVQWVQTATIDFHII